MPKGYWIAHVDVTDADAYKGYLEANAAPFAKFGARFLVRGGTFENPEGKTRARNVVLEFPSYEAALACYRSSDYARALTIRAANATSDVIIIEGYDGPQPGGNSA